MKDKKIDVSIIIVSWNVKELLLECIDSIKKHTKGITYEIIVIDNASADGSAEAVKKKFPNVVLIANIDNVGFGPANNQGVRIAKGRDIVFLNPDTKFLNNVILNLMKAKAESGAMLIGPEQLNGKGLVVTNITKLNPLVAIITLFENLLSPVRRAERRIILRKLVPAYILNAAFWLISKKDFKKIGGFDEDLFLYGEEADVCNRIAKAGGKIYLDRRETIIHYKGQSTNQVPVEQGFNAVFSIVTVFRKTFLKKDKND